MVATKFGVSGGQKIKALQAKAKAKPRLGLEVGFFRTAKYPEVHQGLGGGGKRTPHFVSTVAAWNEFGTKTTPPRPFFRNMVRDLPGDPEIMIALQTKMPMVVNSKTGEFQKDGMGRLGAVVVGKLQESITDLRDPPNAERTIERKGSSNPLIDEGFMRMSATWRVGR